MALLNIQNLAGITRLYLTDDDDHKLTKAVKNNDINSVKFIINANKANNTRITEEDSLYAAMIRGYIEIAIILIENDIGIHFINDFPLALASGNGNYNIVKLLIEHGADVQANNNAALQDAITFKHLEVERLLIEHGANREEAIKHINLRNKSTADYEKCCIVS